MMNRFMELRGYMVAAALAIVLAVSAFGFSGTASAGWGDQGGDQCWTVWYWFEWQHRWVPVFYCW